MSRATRIALIVAVALAAAVAGYLTNRALQPAAVADERAAAAAGARLLALSLPDADGRAQPLAQWRGKVLVVNFWATWCSPCRKEIPDFAATSRRLAAEPVQFVGLAIDTADNVRAFREELKVPYPLLVASPDVLQLASALGNGAQALPFTAIFDRDGRPRYVKLGVLKAADLEGKIRALLAP